MKHEVAQESGWRALGECGRRQPSQHRRAVRSLRERPGQMVVRKAIGWALRDHARTDPGWVLSVVAEHRSDLSGLSQREAVKHLESRPAQP